MSTLRPPPPSTPSWFANSSNSCRVTAVDFFFFTGVRSKAALPIPCHQSTYTHQRVFLVRSAGALLPLYNCLVLCPPFLPPLLSLSPALRSANKAHEGAWHSKGSINAAVAAASTPPPRRPTCCCPLSLLLIALPTEKATSNNGRFLFGVAGWGARRSEPRRIRGGGEGGGADLCRR